MSVWFRTVEYKLIYDYYKDRKAKRSGVHLMDHIQDGCRLLMGWGRSELEIRAFCLHPLVQMDVGVSIPYNDAYHLAKEYAEKANSYLCTPDTDYVTFSNSSMYVVSRVGPMSEECAWMLLADKVQNRDDFMKHHAFTHERKHELNEYFNLWIKTLMTVYL